MLKLLFSPNGRINRAKYWLSVLLWIVFTAVTAGILVGLWQVIPGTIAEDGSFNVEGAQAVPYLVVGFGHLILTLWSGICVGIKRFHDRGQSGAWVLIIFVPFIGSLWYFIVVACLRGQAGPNQYGPDPLAS